MAEKKNLPHKNHRARLRLTFRKTGIENMPDHNILEFLLFYSIPRIDTNELAHRLIDRFGSLRRVFDASYEQLLEIEGMGESSALLISSIPALTRKYIECGAPSKIVLTDCAEAEEYIVKKFYGCSKEILYMLCLDSMGTLINCVNLGEGTSKSIEIDKRAAVENALINKADVVIFAHNHPNGIAAPSKEDIFLTEEFANIFSGIGIRLADHIIVAGNESLSLASVDKFKSLFI
ncbi:MAG: DNA repair protein RadC [Clostridia bacterium]|nr:DNA repair protein RadC [Clostridia bacterium]